MSRNLKAVFQCRTALEDVYYLCTIISNTERTLRFGVGQNDFPFFKTGQFGANRTRQVSEAVPGDWPR